MNFEKDRIFHVYNQGNNRNKIFFDRRNYLFFLQKMRTHVLPYADFLAWCLMPNHFHWMIYIRATELDKPTESIPERKSLLYADNKGLQIITPSLPIKNTPNLNSNIGTLLASYTRAINNQERFTGSLFRKKTNAICLNNNSQTLRTWIETMNFTIINRDIFENQYTKACFDYIHQNPVKAGLVKKPEEWEFSSYSDVYGLRNGKLINQEMIRDLGLTKDSVPDSLPGL